MSAIEEAVASGERSIAAFIENANALSQQISASFPPMTLDEVHAKFAAQPIPENAKPGLNPEVSKLWSLVRHHAALAVDEFRNAEQWLAMKAPSVSDGNNFGVDVQNFVGAEMAGMRAKLQAMLEGLSTYHWQRGLGIEKLPGGKSSETESSETTETEDKEAEKTTSTTTRKKNTSSSTKVKKEQPIDDFVEYCVALDVKAYHSAYVHLTDIRNYYVKAGVLFSKNMKRLSDPRGEGEDGGRNRNVMSMF
ncbi:hypothetical protein AB1Y20_011369 [Prymnesium parvum]|uniref:Proteasome activator PA28 C-terminal domain-containing protein n=1 Tax=Prymnesium parvum TaxID=97485 RepID=A0AB34IMN9_PRYPA